MKVGVKKWGEANVGKEISLTSTQFVDMNVNMA